jgi:hypothetical protein
LFEFAFQELAGNVPKAAVVSEITLIMLWQNLSLFTQELKKTNYILNYPVPSPGTEVTFSNFVWLCSLLMRLEAYKMK